MVGTAGFLSRHLGHFEQAIGLFEYQVTRDPLNYWGHEQLGIAKSHAGRLDEAIAAFRTVLSLAPNSIGEHYYIGEVYLQNGDGDAALAEMKLEPDEQWRLPGLSMAYAVCPMFVSLHSGPRWLPFLRKHGMGPEQLAAIKFDVKVPK